MSSGSSMLKFIWGKGQGPSAERVKIQKQLFGFSREVTHGFPNKPTCLAWDQQLKLLGIAARGGRIIVYGTPGVELEMELEDDTPISKLIFITGQGRLLCVTSDNYIHLIEITNDKLTLVKSHHLEGRLKTVSAVCLESTKKRVLLGTEGGNIYLLRLWNLTMEQEIIYQDKVVRDVPDSYKVNPGAVEAILEDRSDMNRILIGFTRGLVVLWDKSAQMPVSSCVSQQQLESLCWQQQTVDGDSLAPTRFVSSHNDGSYIVWDAATGVEEEPPTTPYGPYPCKSISKFYSNAKGEDSWQVFTGGMPRASYGDKFTVTVMKNEDQHAVLDLTSKVVDFQVVVDDESGLPDSLIILSEEELVALDLKLAGWPQYEVPYLHSIHASAITCLIQATDVKQSLVEDVGKYRAVSQSVSSNMWPVTGGQLPTSGTSLQKTNHDILVTGHEDGSIRFWALSGSVMTPLSTFKTAKFFKVDDFDDEEAREDDEDEDEWPPFRKVGVFDPYSDDPRLAIKKLAFCPEKRKLLVGGTAGQVLVCTLGEAREEAVKICKADIVTEREGFTWKGHQPLAGRTGSLKLEPGWQPKVVLQISPPASITALSFSREWGVLGAGTAHGFVLLDYNFSHVITARSTLNAQDIANADDNPMSRRKSLKKSLRESFRRLRKGRSQRNPDKKKPTSQTNTINRTDGRSDSPEARPVERQIEARGSTSEDGLGSMVRCLHFAKTYIASPTSTSPTVWAGTNSGQVLVFLLNVTSEDKRKNDKITAVLAKEIQLKHRAPVIDIVVYDSGGLPIEGSHRDYPAPHKVLIASEEQFKIFLLPNLKPSGKYKLTAQEGARVRKIRSATFSSAENASLSENCVIFLTNLGEISILVFPELRRQVTTSAIKKEDVVGITSLNFSTCGDGVYMSSSSELQMLTVAAKRVGARRSARGRVVIAPEDRPNTEDPMETDRQADLQNRQNEREVEQNGPQARASPRSLGDEQPQDTHNETTVSDASGDITLDSVKDHIVSQTTEISTTETAAGLRTERIETISRTVESVSVTQTQQILSPTSMAPPSAVPVAAGVVSGSGQAVPDSNGITPSATSERIEA